MIEHIFKTDKEDLGALIARVFLGLVILPHGLQKLLGMFGGYGFTPTVEYFVSIGVPSIVAVLIILGESFGALFLIIGLLSRISAAAIGVIMLGAILMAHAEFGFFMNWFGSQAGEGFEYHLLAIGLALVVVVRGGGKWGLDSAISKKLRE